MQIDYLIVGQGLAGTVLSYTLLKAGARVRVIDQPDEQMASWVAIGAFNPITGRKMVKTWQADAAFAKLPSFYATLEAEIGVSFFHPMPIYRPFESLHQQNDWLSQALEPGKRPFVQTTPGTPDGGERPSFTQWLHDPHGGIFITGGGWLDTAALLRGYSAWLNKQALLRQEAFDYAKVELLPEGVRYEDIQATRLLFAEGAQARFNPYLKGLPFHPAKGEVVRLRLKEGRFPHMVNRGCAVVPLPDGTYNAGANYNHHDLTYSPTEKGRAWMRDKLDRLLAVDYDIIDQKASVRPATRDRRPFVGPHPLHEQMAIFNGFGSKAISLAPLMAEKLATALQTGQPASLLAEALPSRYAQLMAATA